MTSTLDVLSTPEWVKRLTPRWPHELSKVRQLYLSIYEAITHGLVVLMFSECRQKEAPHSSRNREVILHLHKGVPDASLFPAEAWRKAMMVAAKLPAGHLGYRQ